MSDTEDSDIAKDYASQLFYPRQFSSKNSHNSKSMVQKIAFNQAVKKNGAISIENMFSKKCTFIPIGLESKYRQKNSHSYHPNTKIRCELLKIKSKKQLQAHKSAIPSSILQKPQSIIDKKQIFQIPELKQSRYRRNISAVQKIQKQLQCSNEYNDQSKSFYLKPGQKSLRYELKIDIKKFQQQTTDSIKKSQENSKTVLNNRLRSSYQHPKHREKSLRCYINKSYLLKKSNNTPEDMKVPLQKSLVNPQFAKMVEDIEMFSQSSQKREYNIKQNRGYLWSPTKISKKKENEQRPQYKNIRKLLNTQNYEEQTVQLVQAVKIKQTNIFGSTSEQIRYLRKINKNKSARCFSLCLFNHENKQLSQIFMKNSGSKVEIASLTKIMTCFLVINIAKFFSLNLKQQKLLVNEKASKMPGTSADLSYADTLTIYDALHGLMLPSGNDAAVALGNWGGKMIRKYTSLASKFNKSKYKQSKPFSPNQMVIETQSYQKLFIHHMNKSAKILKLKKTNFANTHGLMNDRAFSTAKDIARLTAIAMNNQFFADITGKKVFECSVFNRTFSQTRKIQWKNTNKLLKTQGFKGVKTGVTPSAGPCLSSMYQLNKHQSVIIVVLDVKSLQDRFSESLLLLRQYLTDNQQLLRNRLRVLEKSSQNSSHEKQDDTQKANMINNIEESFDPEQDEQVQ